MKFFPFHINSFNSENTNNNGNNISDEFGLINLFTDQSQIKMMNEIYNQEILKMDEHYDFMVKKFNEMIGPNMEFDEREHQIHNQLIALLDKKNLEKYYEEADDNDKARIKALSNNGVLSWINTTYNYYSDIVFGNQDIYLLLSLLLGGDILENNQFKCRKCGGLMDSKGYHALHCAVGGYLIKRHDKIVDKVCEWLDKCKIEYQKEKRWERGVLGGKPRRIKERPGDIFIKNLNTKDGDTDDIYIDITVGNIFAVSNIGKAAKARLAVAKDLENKKRNKYYNNTQVHGFGIEVLGGMSECFRNLITYLSEVLGLQTPYPATMWKNQIRSQVISVLMKWNAEMMKSCINVIEFGNEDD